MLNIFAVHIRDIGNDFLNYRERIFIIFGLDYPVIKIVSFFTFIILPHYYIIE